ncbi:hypothetical protein EYF80_037680 [Liparis tanakae]|uniref:Uncharacterized protein n=1 Tax=Liparis tanakae TaxID=230148 RepID=A0A4Z2GFX6_9TELE|nr:hypothetical protein EYF80_037680 [Liparis tanakae]
MVRRCAASASSARLLKATPLTTAYQKLLEGSSMTKVTTNITSALRLLHGVPSRGDTSLQHKYSHPLLN